MHFLVQILRYRDKNSDKWHRIKEAEADVSLVKEDYILKGSIDLIEGENDTVEIIDFKSSDKPDINSTELTISTLNQYRRQLEVYGIWSRKEQVIRSASSIFIIRKKTAVLISLSSSTRDK